MAIINGRLVGVSLRLARLAPSLRLAGALVLTLAGCSNGQSGCHTIYAFSEYVQSVCE